MLQGQFGDSVIASLKLFPGALARTVIVGLALALL
jgi:hypothetical protein